MSTPFSPDQSGLPTPPLPPQPPQQSGLPVQPPAVPSAPPPARPVAPQGPVSRPPAPVTPQAPVAPPAASPAAPEATQGAPEAGGGAGQTPPWWPAVEAAYQRSDPTVFDSDEVLDSDGLPDGYTEYLPGETQITWRVLGFREDSPYNAVMEFSDGVIPLLYVPLTPDAVSQFKGAMDQVYAAQNGMPLPASEDSHFIQDLEDALTEDEEVVLDENGEPVKPRMQSWKTWREVQVGSLKATVREPGNRSSWVFAGIMVVSFVLLGACTLINAAVQ